MKIYMTSKSYYEGGELVDEESAGEFAYYENLYEDFTPVALYYSDYYPN